MADLLPKTHRDFTSVSYWDQFYVQRGKRSFEYYGEYKDHCILLHKYCRPKDKILHVGCGNSRLSEELYDAGFCDITNIDTSDVVIRQMNQRNHEKRPKLLFQKEDIRKTQFDDNYFDVVLDKGTLDAMTADKEGLDQDSINLMFQEIHRITRNFGRYICVSLCQERSLKTIVDWLDATKQWMMRIHKIQIQDSETERLQGLRLPIFTMIFTKMMPPKPNGPIIEPVYELVFRDDSAIQRMGNVNELLVGIKDVQLFVLAQAHLSKLHIGEEFQIDLWSQFNNTSPRYSLMLVDSARSVAKNGKFAAFIVPEGRETEWMFATPVGRNQLAVSAGYERLIVVHLQRGHDYKDMQQIQNELSARVLELRPDGLSHKQQIPYLSIGDSIGCREIVYEGKSELSDKFIIEDVIIDNQKFRRLVFLSNKNVVQSEGLLKAVKEKRGKSKKKNRGSIQEVVDYMYLACDHHAILVSGMALLRQFASVYDTGFKMLIIGLGGGSLPMFIHKLFPKISVSCVDIDAAVVDIATTWFKFKSDDNLLVHVDDGLKFINQLATQSKACKDNNRYDIIVFDVNSNDSTSGMSCPPKEFIDIDFLRDVFTILSAHGVFMLNLVCRDKIQRIEVLKNLQSIFDSICSASISEQVNEIIFAMKATEDLAFIDCKNIKKGESQKQLADWVMTNGCILQETYFKRLRDYDSAAKQNIDFNQCLRDLKTVKLSTDK